MTTTKMTTTTRPQRSFFARLLIAFLKFALFIILTAGAVGLSLVVLGEIQRGQARTGNLESQIELLRSDVNAYVLEPRYAARVGVLEQQIGQLASLEEENATLTAANAALTTELAAQAEQLATLQAEMATRQAETAALQAQTAALIAQTQTITENLGLLNNGVGDLQQDVTTSVGGVDALTADITALDETIAGLNETLTEWQTQAEWERGAFRLWGLVLRAQFYLATGDEVATLATIKQAQTAADALAPLVTADVQEALAAVQTSLASAAEELPTDAEATAELLQTAWETWDGLLANEQVE
ncbi:MAG: hypothetical protein OT477_10955 [Chloroflexi bacterium]|nr:hypothetical protein [Chloroflexota bacterium]